MRPPLLFIWRAPAAVRALTVAVAAGVAVGASIVGQAWVLTSVVDGAFLGGRSLGQLTPLLALLAGIALVKAALQWVADQAGVRAASRVKAHLRTALTARMMERGPISLGAERSGELTHVTVRGVEALEPYVAQYMPQAALALLVPLLMGVAVLRVDPLSALVLFLTWPLVPLFMYLVGGVAAERTRARWTVLARLSARFVDALQGLSTLKAFGRAGDEAAAIASATARFRALTMDVLKVAFLSALVLELVATLSTAVVAVQVGLRLLYGHVPFQEALFVLVLAPEFYKPLRTLGAAFHAAAAGQEATPRIAALVEPDASMVSTASVPGAAAPAPRSHGADWPSHAAGRDGPPAIRVAGLTVRYAGQRDPAIDDLSFTVGPGETLAIVGPSGAGKSTVFSALLGFVAPERGVMAIGPIRFDPDHLDRWRQALTWVPQRPYLFSGTLADNLRLGHPEATEHEMRRALARARLADLVESWPRGLHTEIGERGLRLSGGEAQRVALARAFLREAPVVLLDEPTSSLDARTERALGEAIAELRQHRTVLVIAHRLSTVLDANRVIVLEHGRSVEAGSPRELASSRRSRFRAMLTAHGGVA